MTLFFRLASVEGKGLDWVCPMSKTEDSHSAVATVKILGNVVFPQCRTRNSAGHRAWQR